MVVLLASTFIWLVLNRLYRLKNPLDISVPTGVAQKAWCFRLRVNSAVLIVTRSPLDLAGALMTVRDFVVSLSSVLLRVGHSG